MFARVAVRSGSRFGHADAAIGCAAGNQPRKPKDYKAADAIRAELQAKGVEIEDTPTGTKWRLA